MKKIQPFLKKNNLSKTLKFKDDGYNELVVEHISTNPNTYKIYVYDMLCRIRYELAEYKDNKYEIFNEELFDEMFLKTVKNNLDFSKSYNNLISNKDLDVNNISWYDLVIYKIKKYLIK